jgi:uracil-DNA glycosylase
VFRALALPPAAVRVVILGQDPYPTAGNATGLAFSVPADRPLPASLRNIYKEMEADIGCRPATGDLSHWAAQGVLLLNTALTVPVGEANGHAKLGWSRLVREVLRDLSTRPRAFVLWGRPAEKLVRDTVAEDGHLFLASPHPSPLSAHRGFFGSRPFSRVNGWLTARGEPPIDWCGTLGAPPPPR